MKRVVTIFFVSVGLMLVGANVYSSQKNSLVEQNAECLAVASAKQGIAIVRTENFQMTEAGITYDQITTCMPGTSSSCYAGTVHVVMPNP